MLRQLVEHLSLTLQKDKLNSNDHWAKQTKGRQEQGGP